MCERERRISVYEEAPGFRLADSRIRPLEHYRRRIAEGGIFCYNMLYFIFIAETAAPPTPRDSHLPSHRPDGKHARRAAGRQMKSDRRSMKMRWLFIRRAVGVTSH